MIDTRELIDEINGLGVSDWENPTAEELAELDTEDRARIAAIIELAADVGDEFRFDGADYLVRA